MATHTKDTSLVPISEERLRALEALEAELPSRIESAVKQYKLNALQRLHERDKQNPAAVNLRAKRYAERHREEINARRRAKRAEKRSSEGHSIAAAAATAVAGVAAGAAAENANVDADTTMYTRIVRSTLTTMRHRMRGGISTTEDSQSIIGSFATVAPTVAQQPCPMGEVTLRFDM